MKHLEKINYTGIVFLSAVLLWSACSSSPKTTKVIPKDSYAIAVIDLPALIKKGKLYELPDYKMFKALKKEIKNENNEVAEIVNSLIENPKISGLDFTNDIFMYSVDNAKDEKFVSIAAALNDYKKFEKFIEDISKKIEIKNKFENKDNYKYVLLNKSVALAWNEKNVLLLTASNNRSNNNLVYGVESLMTLNKEEQITSSEKFNKFFEKKEDISLWFSTNLFENNREFRHLNQNMSKYLLNNYYSIYYNFDYGKITQKITFSGNYELQQLLKKNNVFDNSFNNKILKYFPNNHFAIFSMSINTMALYNIIEQNNDILEKTNSALNKNFDLELKELFETIKGNFIFSLIDIKEEEHTKLTWGYSFDESKAKLLDDKMEISKAGVLSKEDKKLLNQGKTIQAKAYNGKYCINIKNILENGEDIDMAIKHNRRINWYEGGWTYGYNVKLTEKSLSPITSFAFDISDNKAIKKIIDIIPENKLINKEYYYELVFKDNKNAYIAFDNNIFLFTNDKNSIEKFRIGGYDTNNLNDENTSSDILSNNIYGTLDLNYDNYPLEFKNKIENTEVIFYKQAFKTWKELSKKIEFKQIDVESSELNLYLKSDENSLYTIIKIIDNNYANFISL